MILLRRLRIFIGLLAVLCGLQGLRLAHSSLRPENVVRQDFVQEYLVARAIAAGVAPYQPLPQLVDQFPLPGDRQPTVFPHPSPHTPTVAVLFLPAAFMGFRQAATVWLLIELSCFLFALFLLLRWFNQLLGQSLRLGVMLSASGFLLGWSGVWEDLALGQMNGLLLLLLVGAWLLLRERRVLAGGALLGVALACKLIFWPLVVWLALRRRWTSAAAALASCALLNLIVAAILGGRAVLNYYLYIGPHTGALYRSTAQNLSLWTIGWRVFAGTGSMPLVGITAPPLFQSTTLALLTSCALIGMVLLFGLWAARAPLAQSETFDFGWALMLCVCLLVSPLTWPHYLVMMLLPGAVVLRRLRALKFPRRATLLFLIAGLLLLIPNVSLRNLIASFAATPVTSDPVASDFHVPFPVALLSMIPTCGVLLLMCLTYYLSPARSNAQAFSPPQA